MSAITDGKSVFQDEKGRFLPGNNANPGGRPKGCAKALRDIEETIEEFEKEKGISYWKAATLIAMRLADKGNVSLLSKILDKFVGTKVDIDAVVEGSGETRIIIIRPDGHTDKAKELSGQVSVQPE